MNHEMKRLIAIAGGIGSGKSIVSSILKIYGFNVYDCDAEAKRLMNTSQLIREDLINAFGKACYNEDGNINKDYISSIVFQDNNALKTINSIVHPRVKDDILRALSECKQNIMFVESAILLQSNLLDIISDVWLVVAPDYIRIERVMRRNAMTEGDVMKRIEAQKGQDYSVLGNCNELLNDDNTAMIPQINKLLIKYSKTL